MRLPVFTIATSLVLSCVLFMEQPNASAAHLLVQDASQSDFDQLQDRFQRLYRSLRGKGGFSDADLELIRDMRDRFARFNAQNAGHEGGLAGELQVSMWLEDNDRVDSLFRQLVLANPDNPQYGPAWIAFLERAGQDERVDELYDWLLANMTNTTALRISRARQYKRQSDYARALHMLEQANLDPNVHGQGMQLLAECLIAENRFDEALALLESINDELLANDSRLRSQVQRQRRESQELAELWAMEQEQRSTEAAADDLPRVELVTARGRIIVELFEDSAPNTVANFITLVEDGFYDNTRFHRVEPEFVTQGGDPNTKPDGEGLPGTGGPGYRIPDEWEDDGARKHFAGSLAMAHSGADTAGSQFYITHRPTLDLNRGYTVFGRVLEGLDVARAMQIDDELISATVLRKRDHEYEVRTLRPLGEIEQDLPDFLRSR